MLGNKSSAALQSLVAIAAVAVLLVAAAAPTVHHVWVWQKEIEEQKSVEDFAPTYQAARAMWNGQDIYEASNRLYLYSPFVAFIFQPVAALPDYQAAIVWTVLSAGLIAVSLIMAAKQILKRWRPHGTQADVSLSWFVAAIALLLSFDKVHAELRLVQIDALILLGFVSILIWMDRTPSIAGLMVGVTANIKYLGLIFAPYFIIKRNYRAASISIASFIFFMMLPVVEIGPRLAATYAASALGGLAKLVELTPRIRGQGLKILPISWDRSTSFTSAIFRATNSHGVPDLVGAALVVVAFAGVIGILVFIGRHHGVRLLSPYAGDSHEARTAAASLEWAALIVIAIVFSPQTMARHMVLLSLVYTVAIGIFIAHKDPLSRLLLIVATVVATVGLSFPFRAFGLDELLGKWRAVGGASWCAFLLMLTVTWAGSSAISEMANKPRH